MRHSLVALAMMACVGCAKKKQAAQPPAPKDNVVALTDAQPEASNEEPTAPPPAPTVKTNGKGDCKTEYAPRPTRDPNPMCKVPEAKFTMGAPPGPDDDGRYGERPAFDVVVSPFYMDQFEVTVAQVAFYLNTVKDNYCPSSDRSMENQCFADLTPQMGLKDGVYFVEPGFERKPVRAATLDGARRYCAWAGKVLPTEAQWEAAARFDPATGKTNEYPWGDTYDEGYEPCDPCNAGATYDSDVGLIDGTGGRLDNSSAVGVYDFPKNGETIDGCWQDYPLCTNPPCVDPPSAPLREKCGGVVRGSGGGPRNSLGTNRKTRGGPYSAFRCAR